MDYGKIISNVLTLWYKDAQTLKYLLLYFIVGFAITIILGAAMLFFFGGAVNSYIDSVKSTQGVGAVAAQPDINAVTALFSSIVSNLIPFILIIVPLILIFGFIQFYIEMLIYCRGLQVLGFKTAPFDFGKFLRLIVFHLWVFIAVITSWYNRRLFYVFSGLVALFFAGLIAAFIIRPLGVILLIPWVIIFMIYFFVIIYNSLRFFFATAIFLQKDLGVADAAKESWDFSLGKVVDIVVASIILWVVIFAAGFVLNIPGSAINFVISLAGQPIIAFAFSMLYSLILSPVFVVFGVYGVCSIYAQMIGSNSAMLKVKK